ncbi:MAG: hypothetical protein JNM69_19780 [Archangium sp.]|nr:hypothetical protein [Archangium sp.]
MADHDDRFPLSTPEAIVLDGANSVSGAPRAHFPEAAFSLSLAAVALLVTVVAVRTKRAALVVPVVLGLAALPGLFALVVQRADAPMNRAALTALVKVGVNDLKAQAAWPQAAVQVVRDDDDVLFPLARYAWPSRPTVDGGVALELRGSALITACHHEAMGGHVVCGAGR